MGRDLGQYYTDQLREFYEDVMTGAYQYNDWRNMHLKADLKEGRDFVLLGSALWYFRF